MLKAMELFIPSRWLPRRRDLPWIKGEVRKVLRCRDRARARARAKRCNSQAVWSRYRELRNKAVSAVRRAKRLFFESIAVGA